MRRDVESPALLVSRAFENEEEVELRTIEGQMIDMIVMSLDNDWSEVSIGGEEIAQRENAYLTAVSSTRPLDLARRGKWKRRRSLVSATKAGRRLQARWPLCRVSGDAWGSEGT